MAQTRNRHDVSGVMLERPFRIQRLGHFLFNTRHIKEFYNLYINLLGFQVTDMVDMTPRMKPEVAATVDDTNLYFSRYGSDHHAFIFASTNMAEARGRTAPPGVTVGQISWIVGSLAEVVNGERWMTSENMNISKSGRDAPGSNWHTYAMDPLGHPNELYYGMEQIGWSGQSKPKELWKPLNETPLLPQDPEYLEVQAGLSKGVNLAGGYQHTETMPFDYVVDGIRLPRPFKITSIGPVRLFMRDMDAALAFYRDGLGFRVTEEVVWKGHRCYFLRAKTDHHDLALYPEAVRDELNLSKHSYCMSFGVRVYGYRQLHDAIQFLKERGIEIRYLPPELTPGMDHTAFAVDPDGHLVQLYWYMEQVGWDGTPRPADKRRKIDHAAWPDTIEADTDQFCGDTFMGPWN